MKKFLALLIAVIMSLGIGITAYAEEAPVETTQDASTPRLMVTDYKVEGGSLAPNKKTKVAITLKNFSKTKRIKNIKLSVTEDTGDVKPVGMGNTYVDSIAAGGTYKWTVTLTASPVAQIGEHSITVSGEYEDKYYGAYSSSDILRINVKQSVGVDYSGMELPIKVIADDTVTINPVIMNTGKCAVRNCKVECDITNIETGGATFVGEIAPGEQNTTSINLRIGENIGNIEGRIILTYDDEFGKTYSKEIPVSSTIIERPKAESTVEEKKPAYPLWWLFISIGIVVGGGIGAAIPISIYKTKQRKEDELRL